MKITLKSLANELGLSFQGDPDLKLTHCCGLEDLKDGGLAYITKPGDLKNLPTPDGVFKDKGTDLENLPQFAGAIIVPKSMEGKNRNLLFAEDPLAAHIEAMKVLHPLPKASGEIHPSAVIDPSASIEEGVTIDANVVIYPGVKIGQGTVIRANVTLMHEVVIGKDCLIYPGVSIREGCRVGDRCILHNGVVIGSDGFGFYQRDGLNHKIPQVGKVILGNDVEIGANSCIDRARFSVTRIGDGCKLDNLIHIAHNVELGAHGLMAAQSGVAGSTKIGDHLMMGGQSGIRDNLQVGSQVTLLARTLITSKTDDKEVVAGMPSRPIGKWRRMEAMIGGLENLLHRVGGLERFAKDHGYVKQNENE